VVYKFIFEVALKNNSNNRISADVNLKKKESGWCYGPRAVVEHAFQPVVAHL
jgi:hypothetical protein